MDRTGDGAMSEEKHGRGEQAWRMLDLFASLDVAAFDLTTTDLDGGKREFRRAVSWRALRQWIPHLLNAVIQHQHNLIVRPKCGASSGLDSGNGRWCRLGPPAAPGQRRRSQCFGGHPGGGQRQLQTQVCARFSHRVHPASHAAPHRNRGRTRSSRSSGRTGSDGA